jgi:hypothetical protein
MERSNGPVAYNSCVQKQLASIGAQTGSANAMAQVPKGLDPKPYTLTSRAAQATESIEFEYKQALKRRDRRLIVGIFPNDFRIYY